MSQRLVELVQADLVDAERVDPDHQGDPLGLRQQQDPPRLPRRPFRSPGRRAPCGPAAGTPPRCPGPRGPGPGRRQTRPAGAAGPPASGPPRPGLSSDGRASRKSTIASTAVSSAMVYAPSSTGPVSTRSTTAATRPGGTDASPGPGPDGSAGPLGSGGERRAARRSRRAPLPPRAARRRLGRSRRTAAALRDGVSVTHTSELPNSPRPPPVRTAPGPARRSGPAAPGGGKRAARSWDTAVTSSFSSIRRSARVSDRATGGSATWARPGSATGTSGAVRSSGTGPRARRCCRVIRYTT